MIKLYGISNCDTVRKAGKWLDARGMQWTPHDYRKHGIDAALATRILGVFGPERVINRRGTTWRQLDDKDQAKATDPVTAAELIQAHPALIKRPIVVTSAQHWLLGYDELMTLSD